MYIGVVYMDTVDEEPPLGPREVVLVIVHVTL